MGLNVHSEELELGHGVFSGPEVDFTRTPTKAP